MEMSSLFQQSIYWDVHRVRENAEFFLCQFTYLKTLKNGLPLVVNGHTHTA